MKYKQFSMLNSYPILTETTFFTICLTTIKHFMYYSPQSSLSTPRSETRKRHWYAITSQFAIFHSPLFLAQVSQQKRHPSSLTKISSALQSLGLTRRQFATGHGLPHGSEELSAMHVTKRATKRSAVVFMMRMIVFVDFRMLAVLQIEYL